MDIENFKNNDAVNMKKYRRVVRSPKSQAPANSEVKNSFIRDGKVGNWRQYFSCKRSLNNFETWCEENISQIEDNYIEEVRSKHSF